MNPLLQTPLMVIHPPTRYTGFVGYDHLYAFGMAALITGHLDDSWLRAVRRWTLIGWLFLSFGLVTRHDLGVRGAGLGRLLGLGSGRERLAAAVVHRDRLSALRDDPRETGMMKIWNVVLVSSRFCSPSSAPS